MKKGFTLVELLVVIGIIGLLTSVLMVSMSGGSDSARAAKCLTNMKNLASAVQTYGAAASHYPLAGSVEMLEWDRSSSSKKNYYERSGWLSWDSQGAYTGTVGSSKFSSGWMLSAYEQDIDKRSHSLTNGVLWKYLSGNRDVYVCPEHKIQMAKFNPYFTFVMNEYFRWAKSKVAYSGEQRRRYGTVSRADRMLLFAEFQWKDWGSKVTGITAKTPSESAGPDFDCVLQYSSNNEVIGFNHKSGRDKVAHVVFVDGHTEKLTYPKKGLSDSDLKNLTTWLCEGKDVSFNGRNYEELK